MAMNPYIAEMYNTNGYAEKVAQVEGIVDAFIKQASAEGLDLSGLSDDQIVDYALDWADEQGGDDGQDKLAEADYMGRVMAHAYVDEMNKIATRVYTPEEIKIQEEWAKAKQPNLSVTSKPDAGSRPLPEAKPRAEIPKVNDKGSPFQEGAEKKKRLFDSAKDFVKDKAKSVHERVKGLGGRLGTEEGFKAVGDRGAARALARGAGNEGTLKSGLKAIERSKALRGYGALGAGTALLGGAGAGIYAATRKKESQIAALHEDAVQYANTLLGMAQQGHSITFDKVASVQETEREAIVAELAWELLHDEGYI